MFTSSPLIKSLLCLLLISEQACSTHLVGNANLKRNELEERREDPAITIVKGLLRSRKATDILTDIPCGIILEVENDADKAKEFVADLQNGKVPSIIQDVSQEVLQPLMDMVGIFETLPSELLDQAQATFTDAAHLFDDISSGAIISDIENIPNIVISEVTSGWSDLTSGLENDWNEATHAIGCIFSDCPVPTNAVQTCGDSPQTASAQTSSTPRPSAQTRSPSSQRPVPSSTPTSPYPSWTPPASPSNGIPNNGQYSTSQWNSFAAATSQGLAGSSRAFPGNAQTTSPNGYSNASPTFMRNHNASNRLLLSVIAGSLVFGFFLLL